MAGDSAYSTGTYSPWVGSTYVFNLIVGTGALTLPAAFANAGWAIGLCLILLLSAVSYVTLTFVVETMAVANGITRSRRREQRRILRSNTDRQRHCEIPTLVVESPSDSGSEAASPSRNLLERISVRKKAPRSGTFYSTIAHSESGETGADVADAEPLLPDDDDDDCYDESVEDCDIKETFEMGRMTGMFFNTTGSGLFFVCIAVYLYGDLAIFGAAVGKSLRDASCTYWPPDAACNETLNGTVACWPGVDLSRDDAYRLLLSAFVLTVGSLGFFNVQKTMLLQLVTTLVRWTAFIVMIVLAFRRLTTLPAEELGRPPAVRWAGVPNLFGACVYSFMCHHSLPSLVTPIAPKRRLYAFLLADYLIIAAFYLLLALSGGFAFPHLDDLYTLNFEPGRCGHAENSSLLHTVLPQGAAHSGQVLLSYFLALFPVFTLSTSFPVVTITLRNNLKQLFVGRDDSEYGFFVRRLFFPLLALLPPTLVALVTSDVQLLVGITGSYAGVGVQYIVPALLVFYARRTLAASSARSAPPRNAFASPFRHGAYVAGVLLWAAASIAFVTYDHIVMGQ